MMERIAYERKENLEFPTGFFSCTYNNLQRCSGEFYVNKTDPPENVQSTSRRIIPVSVAANARPPIAATVTLVATAR